MIVEILHSTKGDKKKSIDTNTEQGRGEAHALLKMLADTKCAVFLERGKQTYRVVGYDQKTDKLIVEAGKGKKQKQVTTKGFKAKCAAVAPVAGGL
jgi:hypothetical protein